MNNDIGWNICSCCCSVTKACPTLCNPKDCGIPGSSVLHYLLEFTQIHVHWVVDANPFILCCPILLLPSIFPSIRIFSNELALPIRWSNYWSFSTLRYPRSLLLDHFCLTTSNLPWFMDLTFQAVGVVWSLFYNVWASAGKIQIEWGNLDSWVLRTSRECSRLTCQMLELG